MVQNKDEPTAVTFEDVHGAPTPMKAYLEGIGVTRKYLAKKIKAELGAKTTRFFHRDGEVVDQKEVIDWPTRQKARMDGHKLLGDYPADKLMVGNLEQELRNLSDDELDRRIRALTTDGSASQVCPTEGKE
jgi:hypothetical protein